MIYNYQLFLSCLGKIHSPIQAFVYFQGNRPVLPNGCKCKRTKLDVYLHCVSPLRVLILTIRINFSYQLVSGVSLSKDAHGPALTATIKQPGKHDISVDVTPSLPSNIPVTANCWPRPDTRKALTGSQIDRVTNAGTHLVPKGDTVFATSYSRAEKELLRTIDAGNGCRRECHKVMKRFVQEYCSKSPDGAPGISSHILKVHNIVIFG